MNDIRVGHKVRFLANSYVDGQQYEPTDPSKKLKYLTAEDLRDQLGTMLGTRVTFMRDNEVMVKLDDGRKVITKKQYFLFNKR